MELRDIEIFLTLAEEQHFGRTAQRLFVSTSRVSQAIKLQERAIGGSLFERTSRSVRLTPLGQQLRDDMAPAYRDLNESIARARLAARGVSGRLRVGMMPLNIVDLHVYWKEFRRRNPHCELQLRVSTVVDPFADLRSGQYDVFVAWLPVEEEDLTVGPTLLTDPRLLAVADDHVLAGRTSVGVETLADFPHVSAPLALDYWEDAYFPFNTPRGRRLERVHPVATVQDVVDLVGMGETVQIYPTHVTRYWTLPNIRWLTLPDLSSLSFALIWRTEAENDLIRSLADTVRDLGTLSF
ncbi:LysR family transcriptional regulator [Kitasatospora sp. NBC_01287]|uniref:LysR family transcriptional regulator n=1 Tax=Kitasatospora sp. NBC_01287 TaxID=2903573 RepID=UPI00224FDF06|nr:LysR family transcriptional regulator [Kitasatospora sp. NBC_01287]MCX4749784.1 LysR family transcriptional regulator [Kitasatospora sp. NBC_01287]